MYKRKPKKPISGYYEGYPYVNSYKYLGTILANNMSINGQI